MRPTKYRKDKTPVFIEKLYKILEVLSLLFRTKTINQSLNGPQLAMHSPF